jgi:anthranilate phosphoribosyltransferase
VPAPTWSELLTSLLAGETLDATDTAWAMGQVMEGEATPAQVAGFVVALRAKGETPSEVAGLVEEMLRRAVRIDVPGPAVDTCGTGGDRAHTVNISTMSALVVAAAGGRVVKHGNRAASSRCGSADLLEELGVAVDLDPAQVPACVAEAGIGFCFAPHFHPALRHASVARRDLGVATIFNFLGPLTNPAQPGAQAVGVSDPRMAGVMADVLAARDTSALVFRGDDGLDELTTTTTSHVWVVAGGEVTEVTLDPRDLGLERVPVEALRGGDAPHNADVVRRLLAGERGPVRDAVLLNAAAALAALAPSSAPLVDRLGAALGQAAEAVDSGAAGATLTRWTDASTRLRTASPS